MFPEGRVRMSAVIFAFGDVSRVGGTERRMSEVSQIMINRGKRLDVVFRRSRPSPAMLKLFAGQDLSILARGSWLAYFRYLLGRASAPITIVSFGLKPSIVARAVKRLRPRNVSHFMARNGLDYEWPRWYHAVDNITSRAVDAYIANSYSVRDHLITQGAQEDRIKVVTSALSAEWYSKRHSEGPSAGDPVRIILVGNSRPEKNQIEGLLSLAGLEVALDVVVYTDDASRVAAEVDGKFGADAKIQFHEGIVVDAGKYDRADILLHPSVSESLPRAVLEGAARGCTVVAFDVGDTQHLVDATHSKIVPLRGGREALTDAVTSVITDLETIRRGRHFGVGQRDVEAYTDEFLSALEVPW